MRRYQMYLTEEQVRALDRRARKKNKSVASLVRDAVDRYIATVEPEGDYDEILKRTFGAIPDFEVPPRSVADRFDRDWNRIPRPDDD